MALKARVKTLEEVDEAHRSLYREDDDGYVLDVEGVGGWSLEDVSGLKSTLEDKKQRLQRLRDKLGGLDPAEAREAVETLRKLEDKLADDADDDADDSAGGDKGGAADDKGGREWEQRMRQMEKRFQEQLDQVNKQREEERERFIRSRKEALATEALSAHTDDVAVLKPHLLGRMFQEEQNGEVVFRVRGDDGEPILVTKSGSTDPVDVLKEYVGVRMKDEFPRNFPGNRAAGGGMGGQESSASPAPKTVKPDDIDGLAKNIEDIAAGKVVVED